MCWCMFTSRQRHASSSYASPDISGRASMCVVAAGAVKVWRDAECKQLGATKGAWVHGKWGTAADAWSTGQKIFV